MNKEELITYLKQVQPTHITNDCINLVYYYLNKKFDLKDKNIVQQMPYVNAHRFLQGRTYIIDKLQLEFNIIEIFDKENKLITIL
jgi:hypothetical protein